LPVDAQASPHKTRGEASVRMDVTGDNATAAIDTLHDIRKDIETDPKNRPEDYAVLARTNKELNDFETACIINEIPYMRRGGSGFLDAPESKAILGYIDLAGGTDFVKKQKSLIDALMKPDRGLYLGPDKVEIAVREAIDDVARYERKDEKDIDPNILLTDRTYARKLAEYLKGPYKNQLMAKGPWLWNKIVDGLTAQILDMGRDVHEIRKITVNPEAKTQDLLKAILDNVTGTTTNWDPALRREVKTTQTLRENISSYLKLSSDDDDDDETTSEEAAPPELDDEGRPIAPKKEDAPENPGKGLGAVQFLYALSKPPAVTLTTVHSVKGLEWPHVTVLMPSGLFPIELKTKPGEQPPSPEEIKEHDVSERNLAYVALTRAAKNLTVISIPNPKTKSQSPYITDAGLVPGENVPKAEAPTPSVKTASDDQEITEGMWHYAQWPNGEVSYDRRPA
jgi:superfamily I DNA/RNA helicase